jgi:hypothetical protein
LVFFNKSFARNQVCNSFTILLIFWFRIFSIEAFIRISGCAATRPVSALVYLLEDNFYITNIKMDKGLNLESHHI